uniref:Outer membrane protein n=1 Tax=Rheinheimera sp. BAL341 TaxID=1708203 RepID=A0A486XL92_9GAMM
MKKWSLIVGLSSGLLTASVQADTLLGLYIGADAWQPESTGGFAESSQSQSFEFGGKTQATYFFSVEHPIPLVPNVRIQHNQLNVVGSTSLTRDFSFAGEEFSAGSTVYNKLDLSNTDYVLYYEILDTDVFSVDLGISAKSVKGDVEVSTSDNAPATRTLSVYIPTLYGAAKVGLPLTGLDVFGQGTYVSYDGNQLYDVQFGVGYSLVDNLALDMRLKLGYRTVYLRLDDAEGVYTNIDFDGYFAGVELHF